MSATVGNLLHNITTPDSECKRLGWLVSARLRDSRVLVDIGGGCVRYFWSSSQWGLSGLVRLVHPECWDTLSQLSGITLKWFGTNVCTAWKVGGGVRGDSSHELTIALHGLLGSQDERCKTGEGLRQLQERMLSIQKKKRKNNHRGLHLITEENLWWAGSSSDLQQLFAASSFFHVHLQATVKELSEHWGQFLWVLELGCAIRGNQVQCLKEERSPDKDIW